MQVLTRNKAIDSRRNFAEKNDGILYSVLDGLVRQELNSCPYHITLKYKKKSKSSIF